MCNLINTYIHTYIHTYILHTYITYIHTYIRLSYNVLKGAAPNLNNNAEIVQTKPKNINGEDVLRFSVNKAKDPKFVVPMEK